MDGLDRLMKGNGVAPAPMPDEARLLVAELGNLLDGRVYPTSLVGVDGRIIAMIRRGDWKHLLVVRPDSNDVSLPIQPLHVERGRIGDKPVSLSLFEMNSAAARLIREWTPFARPQVIGLRRSFGAGDRLGLAGAGHIRAARLHGKGIGLVIAQQSARELVRTHRTHQEVLDAATWAVLQEGYREPWGADADHLKTPADVDSAASAGFTMFTIDPGDHVDDEADRLEAANLTTRYERLPWHDLGTSGDGLRRRYVGIKHELGDGVELGAETPEALLRAAVKYGRAVVHAASMSRHIAQVMGSRPFEIEVSVDETATPTSAFEHFFVANQLKRLGVSNLVSLAPRFIGEFEKGIDYKGDLGRFEETIRHHVTVARHCGPYKLSIHSGSDKFSAYPIVARHAGDLVHVKTAGTSYLEALRVIGRVDSDLFREIYTFAYGRYEKDRASYHVSATMATLPRPDDLTAEQMPGLLDQVDTRQVFHVTFGSVLTEKDAGGRWRFRDRLLADLEAHEDAHYEALIKHIGRHMKPFAAT
jgi:hypothetical protein